MNNLILISGRDFEMKNVEKGPVLKTRIKGFSLVLYYSNDCQYCSDYIKLFKVIGKYFNQCQYCIINVSKNKNLVKASTQTICPIEYVPLIIFYVDGMPYIKYEGPADLNNIVSFLSELINHLMEQKMKQKQNNKPTFSLGIPVGSKYFNSKSNKIPEFCIAHPFNDLKKCYVDYSNAYGNKK